MYVYLLYKGQTTIYEDHSRTSAAVLELSKLVLAQIGGEGEC